MEVNDCIVTCRELPTANDNRATRSLRPNGACQDSARRVRLPYSTVRNVRVASLNFRVADDRLGIGRSNPRISRLQSTWLRAGLLPDFASGNHTRRVSSHVRPDSEAIAALKLLICFRDFSAINL